MWPPEPPPLTSKHFPSPASSKFLGEAHVFNNTIRLTQDLLVPNTGAGRNNPVRFLQPGNPTPVNFTTTFTFTIANLNPNSIGAGLTFVISPNDEAIGDAGGHMGVPTGAVAVEFDTSMGVEFEDVNGNHVGLDLDSMVSSHVVDLHSVKVNLRSGEQEFDGVVPAGVGDKEILSESYSVVEHMSFAQELEAGDGKCLEVKGAFLVYDDMQVHGVNHVSLKKEMDRTLKESIKVLKRKTIPVRCEEPQPFVLPQWPQGSNLNWIHSDCHIAICFSLNWLIIEINRRT
ncbi:hypothetical protein L6452_13948 [Arctium lappa]|uniref:Uncharacterized protein n=1 Tax=Arctium lappa TaxID=4217 RepID=A0ACB9CJY4_ARCLA|nr:hypothetical protein L6452_13948 [Arctium lappa]